MFLGRRSGKLDTVAQHRRAASLAVGRDLVSVNDPAVLRLDYRNSQLGAACVYAEKQTH
jgi:hypothetical protein